MSGAPILNAFGKGAKEQSLIGLRAVIYTRVSSKDQATNLSLDTQRKACIEYALKKNYDVVKFFGATYESATSDNERKEFSNMLSFVKKSHEKISHIIVFSLDRFSRNLHSIAVTAELKKLNILVESVTQPIDMTSSVGQMHANMTLLFSTWENELRISKCTAGMKEMLLRGDFPTNPPYGYDSLKLNGKRTIVINERGKILRRAFEWKADENLTNEAILKRLATKGVILYKQKLAHIFRNPFYCGYIAHNMLDGAVVKGNHEALISQELFLRVNGIMDTNTHGYKIQEENDHLPLKRFLRCGKCNQMLHGYVVKKKGIHYYKCSTVGCGTNRNASVLNNRFAEVLEVLKLDVGKDVLKLIKQQAIATFNQFTKGHEDSYTLLQKKHTELITKIARLEERFIEEDITSELYYKYIAKYNEEKEEVEQNLQKASEKVSNLSECVDLAIKFATDMPKKWLSADYHTKQRLQYLLFPEGITYERETDQSRTTRINSVFLHLAHLKRIILNEKSEMTAFGLNHFALSNSVAGAGLEPTTFGL